MLKYQSQRIQRTLYDTVYFRRVFHWTLPQQPHCYLAGACKVLCHALADEQFLDEDPPFLAQFLRASSFVFAFVGWAAWVTVVEPAEVALGHLKQIETCGKRLFPFKNDDE